MAAPKRGYNPTAVRRLNSPTDANFPMSSRIFVQHHQHSPPQKSTRFLKITLREIYGGKRPSDPGVDKFMFLIIRDLVGKNGPWLMHDLFDSPDTGPYSGAVAAE
jgi:hypothetical protein